MPAVMAAAMAAALSFLFWKRDARNLHLHEISLNFHRQPHHVMRRINSANNSAGDTQPISQPTFQPTSQPTSQPTCSRQHKHRRRTRIMKRRLSKSMLNQYRKGRYPPYHPS